MRLVQLAAGATEVPLALVGADPELAADVQAHLAEAGLLDPPADRLFGPVSQWALGEFLVQWGLAGAQAIDRHVASALLQGDTVFPLLPGDDLAGDIARALLAAGHWLCRHPQACNIVYVEGMGPDGSPNDAAAFTDTRVLLRVGECGRPRIAGAWEGSTAPAGAARIPHGQYKAWSVGLHRGGTAYDALVQTAPVPAQREGDAAVREGLFGLDQHCGDDLVPGGLPRTCAGALVGRTKSGHREFMAMVRTDPRYAANRGYRFQTTVLPLEAVQAVQ